MSMYVCFLTTVFMCNYCVSGHYLSSHKDQLYQLGLLPETLCVLNKSSMMDNIEKRSNFINVRIIVTNFQILSLHALSFSYYSTLHILPTDGNLAIENVTFGGERCNLIRCFIGRKFE